MQSVPLYICLLYIFKYMAYNVFTNETVSQEIYSFTFLNYKTIIYIFPSLIAGFYPNRPVGCCLKRDTTKLWSS